jgi:Curli production assembly/transport component CsgG
VNYLTIAGLVASTFALSACLQTAPTVGDAGAKTAATGAAGGSTTNNASGKLEKCAQSLGTLAVVEDQGASWYITLQQYKLQSTVPVLRMLVQQSNCFVVVERGRAMGNMMQERALAASGEMRAGSNMGKGQMAAADYTMSPTITFAQKGTGGLGGALAGRLGGSLGGMLAGGVKFSEASTMLLLVDNRSSVQLSAAEGSSKNTDFNLFGGLFGASGAGGMGGYTNTPEGKLIVAAFMDSYNQMVVALRNYKAQEVQGGLGTGGQLGVQGGSTPASQAVSAPAAGVAPVSATSAPSAVPAAPATPATKRPAAPRKPAQ